MHKTAKLYIKSTRQYNCKIPIKTFCHVCGNPLPYLTIWETFIAKAFVKFKENDLLLDDSNTIQQHKDLYVITVLWWFVKGVKVRTLCQPKGVKAEFKSPPQS